MLNRPRKKKRKQQANQKSKDQGLEMENLEKNLSSTNKGGYNVLSMNKSINMYEEREENFVLGPCITNYDKDTRNRKLPEITRFNGVEGDEHVYYEIDDDKIKPSTDMEGVHLKRIEVMDNVSFHSDQTTYETQLRYCNIYFPVLIVVRFITYDSLMTSYDAGFSHCGTLINRSSPVAYGGCHITLYNIFVLYSSTSI